MYKKAKEDSILIDFQFSSDSTGVSDLADRLMNEFNITRKHLPRKKQILINLITNLVFNYSRGFNTAIPRGENFYSKIPSRYKSQNMSHDIIIDFIDKMKENNKYVIECFKASRNEPGEVSQYRPSDLLVSLTENGQRYNLTLSEEECILLRKRVPKNYRISDGVLELSVSDSDTEIESDELTAEELIAAGLEDEGQLTKNYRKILVDYSDNDYTRSIRSDLNEYNRFRIRNSISLKDIPEEIIFHKKYKENVQRFASVNISKLKPDSKGNYHVPIAPDKLVRIFTNDFDYGGRFYRGFETQLKKELRPFIAINNEPTIEFDYSAYHIRMIYHQNNKRCPEDPYTVVEGLDPKGRDYYKMMVVACLNNRSEKAVLKTMRYYIIKKKLQDSFPNFTNEGLQSGLDLLKKHNRSVVEHFFQGDGLKYHRIDSDIANSILMYYTRLRNPILVLCVHDSFIIAKQYENKLKWAMNRFYREKLQKRPKIK